MTESTVTRHALDRVARVARTVTEDSTPAAVGRLLERLAARDDGQELRDALVILGAQAVLQGREARP